MKLRKGMLIMLATSNLDKIQNKNATKFWSAVIEVFDEHIVQFRLITGHQYPSNYLANWQKTWTMSREAFNEYVKNKSITSYNHDKMSKIGDYIQHINQILRQLQSEFISGEEIEI